MFQNIGLMVFIRVFCLVVLLASPHLVSADDKQYCWGEAGYDKRKSKRFCVRPAYQDAEHVEIWVDSHKAQEGISSVEMTTAKGSVIASERCWKAQKHPSAPIACSFDRADFKNLSGIGQLEVIHNSRIIHKVQIDFDRISAFLNQKSLLNI